MDPNKNCKVDVDVGYDEFLLGDSCRPASQSDREVEMGLSSPTDEPVDMHAGSQPSDYDLDLESEQYVKDSQALEDSFVPETEPQLLRKRGRDELGDGGDEGGSDPHGSKQKVVEDEPNGVVDGVGDSVSQEFVVDMLYLFFPITKRLRITCCLDCFCWVDLCNCCIYMIAWSWWIPSQGCIE